MKYTCANCGNEYEGRSEEDANAEAKNLWGVDQAASDPRMVVVCDDCFKKMNPADHPQLEASARRELGTL